MQRRNRKGNYNINYNITMTNSKAQTNRKKCLKIEKRPILAPLSYAYIQLQRVEIRRFYRKQNQV